MELTSHPTTLPLPTQHTILNPIPLSKAKNLTLLYPHLPTLEGGGPKSLFQRLKSFQAEHFRLMPYLEVIFTISPSVTFLLLSISTLWYNFLLTYSLLKTI